MTGPPSRAGGSWAPVTIRPAPWRNPMKPPTLPTMKRITTILKGLPAAALGLVFALPAPSARAANAKPNILVIMGDDIGMWNIGAYHRGMMAGRTPNLDKIAKEGMLFTDYYAEASCTAGRANFITGELPIRTGMTTVGQAGAPTGIPAQAVTIAQALKGMGYATGQFGKNHLGDKAQQRDQRRRPAIFRLVQVRILA